jgi:hypothetical protein
MALLVRSVPRPVASGLSALWGLIAAFSPASVLAQSAPDYAELQKALEAQNFQRANELTREALLQGANRQNQGWLRSEDIQKIPCADLQKLDQLWREASQGRFGFGVQYSIFVKTGNRPGRLMSADAYERFGEAVGWRKDGQWVIFKQNIDFSLAAPIGHLPNPRDEYQINGGCLEYTALTERLQTCQVTGAPEKRN